MLNIARTIAVIFCVGGLLVGCDGVKKDATLPAKTFDLPKQGPKPAGG